MLIKIIYTKENKLMSDLMAHNWMLSFTIEVGYPLSLLWLNVVLEEVQWSHSVMSDSLQPHGL